MSFADNKRARFDYEILETLQGGLVLSGQEVKSIRAGRASLAGAFVTLKAGEAFLTNATIPAWQPKNAPPDYNDTRSRKVLVQKKELSWLVGKLAQRHLTAIPLRLYSVRGKIKVEIGIAKHRKKMDKREVIKKRESEREIKRHLKM
ncbi:MAG: SsrA-binding protein [Candidatus Terrybacteria bacterium RIFCSPHIGHO2_01_FULL_48_17]|uniref:SsrA-binding protein n=1 Tax=Candidatus Terrybacteria bacterium RIFCSPHIGHO2_01_FULL_48_17 TaxID=1802362 RepID=A0A1G2PKZ2_9BACT|nr:MAG: SsrA-binding protein [Candidatus Terrybacteria bacterium RIFCSPHIGHO2_01_FULL_48_17]OHA53764.1 MAG: SsrA-binding protein [Candidatus Terrybacteria bacterium RIFCSPLOWO2_01_FULL_48_14]